MKDINLSILLLLFSLGCKNSQKTTQVEAPKTSCLEEQIKQFQDKACPKGAKVEEYLFQGKTVYLFDRGTCGADQMQLIIDAHCQKLGSLGGITGNMNIQGQDFSQAKLVEVVWKK